MKILKSEVFPPILIFLISFLLWRHIPLLQFVGEGFQYFEPSVSKLYFHLPLPHDLFAKLLFNVLPPLFGGQTLLYMWFLFVYMLLVDVIFYFVVRVITNNKLIGFLSAFLLSISYEAVYDMYSIGGYQYFVQRGTILLPLLFSFMFFVLYFTRKFRLRYWVISLTLYVFGIIMGFFGTWFLPPFIFYPIFYLLFNLKRLRKLLMKIIWTPLPFLVSNILLIRQSDFIPAEESLLEFILNRFWYVVSGILVQLAVVTPPFGELLRLFGKESLQFQIILVLTALIYISVLIVISKLSLQFRILAATALASAVAMLLFNVYLNAATVLNTFGSSRYFYFPFTMVVIFWGLFFSTLASRKRPYLKFLVFSICFIWVLYNNYRINENLKADAWIHKANKEAINYIVGITREIKKDSLFELPGNIGPWGYAFISRFYGKPEIKFYIEVLDPLDLEKVAQSNIPADRIYVLHYDLVRQTVVDQTVETRRVLRELKSRINKK